jgi:KTSC domain
MPDPVTAVDVAAYESMARLIRTSLESSSLASIVYDPSDGTLEVAYRRTGHLYRYFGVSRAMYRALMDADSKGAFLNQVIKSNCEYTRVDIPLG